MKKIGILIVSLFLLQNVMSQAVITFDEKEYNFGKIEEHGGKVTHEFNFTNTGDSTLTITSVRASCGCTTPSWTKTPIEPGKTGKVTVTFNPMGRPGGFNKVVRITTNSSKEDLTNLIIRGEVTTVSAPTTKPIDLSN